MNVGSGAWDFGSKDVDLSSEHNTESVAGVVVCVVAVAERTRAIWPETITRLAHLSDYKFTKGDFLIIYLPWCLW